MQSRGHYLMLEHVLAERMSNLGTENAFEVLARAKQLEAQGKDVIHLEIGEPDFDTPRNIVEAGVEALRGGYTHYSMTAGMLELRETIVEYTRRYKGVTTNVDEVVVVPGGKPIIFFSILTLVNPGDEVIYPNPGFPIYESVIRFAGGIPVPMPLLEGNDFRTNIEDLKKKISSRTKMLILNSPANPTGGVLTEDDLVQIAQIIRGKDIFILSDEIYSRIYYEERPGSIAALEGMKDKTIILDGFSKTYAMTGWRIGYGVMHPEIAKRVAQLMVNSNSCTASFTQMAAREALMGPQDDVDRMVDEFKRRRDLVVEGLNSIPGINCRCPQGAFYAFPNISSTGMTSKAFAEYLLNHASVAALSGSSFGEYGEGHIRLSYANSMENLHKALERIYQAVKQL